MSPQDGVDAIAFHSKIATDFNASYKHDPNRLERLATWRACLKQYLRPGRLAYDIGCGSGMLTAEIAPYAEAITAIDGSSAMIALARQNMVSRGFRHVSFIEARLPIRDVSGFPPAETVISSSVIEYLPSLPDALAFLRALMAPGGTLVFSMSNRDSLNRKIVRLVHRLTGKPRYFGFVIHFVDPAQVRDLLRHAGLTYVAHEYFGHRDRLNRIFGLLLPKRFCSNMILFVARRDV